MFQNLLMTISPIVELLAVNTFALIWAEMIQIFGYKAFKRASIIWAWTHKWIWQSTRLPLTLGWDAKPLNLKSLHLFSLWGYMKYKVCLFPKPFPPQSHKKFWEPAMPTLQVAEHQFKRRVAQHDVSIGWSARHSNCTRVERFILCFLLLSIVYRSIK